MTKELGWVAIGPMSIEALIKKIAHVSDEGSKDKLDLFEQDKTMRAIVEHGLPALPMLFSSLNNGELPPHMTRLLIGRVAREASAAQREAARGGVAHYLTPERTAPTRRVAIQVLSEDFPGFDDAVMAVLQVAEDGACDHAVRKLALVGLTKMRLSAVPVMRLLRLLEDSDPAIVTCALDVLATQSPPVDATDVYTAVLGLITSSIAQIRRRAIDVLGLYAEIDTIEHVCMLASTKPDDADAVRSMIYRILSRPRNVIRLQPKNFEHLIKQLLLAMNFEKVRVSTTYQDGGIDVEASVREQQGSMQQQRRVLVQCKRYSSPVGREEVAGFIERTLKPAQSAQGLFITTSSFAAGVQEVCGGQRLELIDGAQLQGYLDQHFGAGTYCIRV